MKSKPLRLLLVDDHQVVLLGLQALFSSVQSFEVVATARNASQAMAEFERVRPDVVLLDVRLPDRSGFDVCREIKLAGNDTKVIILTSHADDEVVLKAITAGADGYLLKEIDTLLLITSIKKVAAGESILDPAISKNVMELLRNATSDRPADRFDQLSPQERRILELVSKGKTNKEIAMEMSLSDKTVKNYFSHILEKLQMSRRSQAAAFFVEQTHRLGRDLQS
ncbi:MAG: response regulator transcription factor [Opitutaceae bacterium]|nr:response regulator transcription factor [Verrucomicrobiales bacterium]